MTERSAPVPATATSDFAAWSCLALLALGVTFAEWHAPMPIEAASLTTLGIACTALGGAAVFYRSVRLRDNFAVMCIALAQVLLFSALGVALSYMMVRNGGTLWDDRLAQWDSAFGFNWMNYVRWVDKSEALTIVFRIAYASLIPQIIMLVLALGFTNRLAQLRTVMLGAILCGSACILVSAYFPAISNPAHLGLTGRDFAHVNPWGGYLHLADFNALRDGSFSTLDLRKAQGIITFPSYHAGLSLVTMWGFWLCGNKVLRIFGMTLAALTIAATPVDGGHYLVDVLGGLAVAILSLGVAARAVRWRPVWPRLTASPFRRSHATSGQ